jgi:MFS family permease
VTAVTLGLRANAAQFALLVALNALVGAMVGLERSVLPIVGEQEFGLVSRSAILSFVVGFGAAKALANLAGGPLADRLGRRRVLLLGWALALPVPALVGLARGWEEIVVANVFLGASQGLAWSMTVLMKIDLVGPARRGLALGLNESAGYVGVALAAAATGAGAASVAPRTLVWSGAAVLAVVGLAATAAFVRETSGHVAAEQLAHTAARVRGALLPLSQAGFVNNLNDALAWGLVPLYLAASGASPAQIGAVAALYPGVWGLGQVATGWLSDHAGRRPLIVAGMLVQATALGVLAAGGGAFTISLAAAALLGIGTALVYPTLLAAVSDAVPPVERARAVGTYRFWRDAGLVAGALVAGGAADVLGSEGAIVLVAFLTAGSGIWVATSTSGEARADDDPGRDRALSLGR